MKIYLFIRTETEKRKRHRLIRSLSHLHISSTFQKLRDNFYFVILSSLTIYFFTTKGPPKFYIRPLCLSTTSHQNQITLESLTQFREFSVSSLLSLKFELRNTQATKMAPDITTAAANAAAAQAKANGKSRAFVTFLAGNGDYIKGVVGLAKGLRKVKSKYPLVVAILPDVPPEHRRILVAQGCIVREIEPVYPPENQTQFAMAYYVINYSKLRIWEVRFCFCLFVTLSIPPYLHCMSYTYISTSIYAVSFCMGLSLSFRSCGLLSFFTLIWM